MAEGAEARGIGTIWVGEHVVLFEEYSSNYPYAEDGRIPAPPGSGLLEPLITLTYLAARTSTVRLGTAMLLLPQRNPVYVAKEVSSLDWLSGGRVDLGVGVGWLKEEFDALNVPWAQRGRRTDEYLEVLRTPLGRRPVGVPRRDLRPAGLRDVPQAGPATPPADPHRRRDPRRAASGGPGRAGLAHLQPVAPSELAAGLAELDGHLEEAGRSRADLRITVCPYFQAADARRRRAVRRGGRRCRGRPVLRVHPRGRGAGVRRPGGLPGGGGTILNSGRT